jgi:hypothetical protein
LEIIMKIQLSRQTALLAMVALSGALLVSACGGGGGGSSTPPLVPPAVIEGPVPGVVEGTVSGAATGTTTGTVNGTSVGVSSGTISGTSVGIVNGTVTGTVTQAVGTSTTSSNVVNTLINSTSAVTVTGAITGSVTGTVNGTVSGTVAGTVTGTVTGVIQGTATGTVTPPAVSAAPASAIAKGFLQSFDALRASYKSTGADQYSLHDGCYLGDGASKAYLINDWNTRADNQARTAFDVASTRANTTVTVLADRTATNADGTQRRELDIKYGINYTDGSKDKEAIQTIISGSSSGARLADGSACAASESKAAWRFYGNRKIVDFSMLAVNEDINRSNLSDGADKTPFQWFNNYMDIRLRDPANVATYYTISGPGLKTSAGATTTFIAVSPRLLRSDPLFAGKVGNNVDWRDIDSFRFCRVSPASGTFEPAATANCPTNGASGASYGSFNNTTDTAADTNFNAFGFALGAVYNIKVYAGNGWQTVNGFASATPIATYTYTLDRLPYSAAALRPASGLLFPDTNGTVTSVVAGSDTSAKIAQSIRDKTALTANLSWQTPPVMPDGTRAAVDSFIYFVGGPVPGGAVGSWPRSRQLNLYYPASGGTSFTWNQAALNSNIGVPNFGSVNLSFTNRNGNLISSIGTWD